jgi:hypothetical protein
MSEINMIYLFTFGGKIYTYGVEVEGAVKYIALNPDTNSKVKVKFITEFRKSGMEPNVSYKLVNVDYSDMNCSFIDAEDVVCTKLMKKLLIIPVDDFL